MTNPEQIQELLNTCTHYFEFEKEFEGVMFFHCRNCNLTISQFEDTKGGA